MSLDYLEDACDALDNYEYPWVILLTTAPEKVSHRWRFSEDNAEFVIDNLYELIKDIKEEYDIL